MIVDGGRPGNPVQSDKPVVIHRAAGAILIAMLVASAAVACGGIRGGVNDEGRADANPKFAVAKGELLVVFASPLTANRERAILVPIKRHGGAVVKKLLDESALLVSVEDGKRPLLLEGIRKVEEIEFVFPNRLSAQLSDVKRRPDCVFGGVVSVDQIIEKGRSALKGGAHLLNLSLGIVPLGDVTRDELLEEKRRWRESLILLVRHVRAADAILVLAAGNAGVDGDDTVFPPWVQEADQAAWREHVIVVGASGRDDRPSDFSDKGKIVEIYAPGDDLELPRSRSHEEMMIHVIGLVAPEVELPAVPPAGGETMMCSGTSFAAAIVSGVVALARGEGGLPPPFPAAGVKNLLVETADVGLDGIRIPNAKRLVEAIQRVKASK